MNQEGNLQAPIRHPIRWQEEGFYSVEKIQEEMNRIFDICHGCRRCFSLCQAFPTLFSAIDETSSGELSQVPKKVYWKVVDQCYLCDLCYLTKCPYTPPHPFNVDFPHTMLRARAVRFKQQRTRWRDRVLTSTDAVGRLASIPVVVEFVNKALESPLARTVLEKTWGIHAQRKLPRYQAETFLRQAKPKTGLPIQNGPRTSGKVLVYGTCYVNYNEPNIGLDLIKVLEHNNVVVDVLAKEACCGMPKMELGDLESVQRLMNINIPLLLPYVRQGYAITAAVPSCVLMFKHELPLLFPEDERVLQVAAAFFDPFEYLMMRHSEGLLKTDFKEVIGRVSYHIPCHVRVQNMGQKTREFLELIPEAEIHIVERCSGHDGSWGVKREFFENSMKIGAPVFKRMAEGDPDVIVSDCPIATRHIGQGMKADIPQSHPLSLVSRAYGLSQ
jgi:Fe-S oxidoreductase